MNDDPLELLFGGMEKLGPGSDELTIEVLRSLPRGSFETAVDAGCGTGRQTLALANELQSKIHAVDNHQPFLDELLTRAKALNLDQMVEVHCMDMQKIPNQFQQIELLWCEGAAYNIGFENALQTWLPAIKPAGFIVVSELCWLTEQIPEEVRKFFDHGYPEMKSVDENRSIVEGCGFNLLSTSTLPDQCWIQGYYDILLPRATALVEHANDTVREFAKSTIEEIELFNRSENSYGYVFFVAQK